LLPNLETKTNLKSGMVITIVRKQVCLNYIGILFLLIIVGWFQLALPVFAEEYRLGPGDEIDVSVWGDQGWQTKQLTIRPDGKLALAVSLTRSEDYLLGPGDVLDVDVLGYEELQTKEVLVHEDGQINLAVSVNLNTEYRLKQGDVLTLMVYRFPELQVKELVVRPDGKISVPLVGEIAAGDTSIAELTKEITNKLAIYIKNPQVTVDVVKFHRIPEVRKFQVAGISLGDLRCKLTAAFAETVPNPQVRVRVARFRPIPISSEITSSGMTITELTRKLTGVFGKYIKNPKITINITKFKTMRVYVLGEVTRPGMYEIEKCHNLLDALGLAGGHTRRAAKRSVYVVRKATGECQKINLNALLKKADLTQNLELSEGDVVYLADNKLNFIDDILPYITALYQIRHM
jgi:polysaccharide export outer membrane protein